MNKEPTSPASDVTPCSLSFSSEMPTREGGYWMICMENEHEKEWVKVFERNGILMADLDLGIYDVRSIHNGLADVKWAHAISVIPENVKEHATPLAGASVETGVEVHVTGDVADRAASGGCCVSTCSESSIVDRVEFNELDAVQIRQLSLYKFEVCLFGRGHEEFFKVLNDNLDQILDARMCLKTFPSKWLTSPLVRSRNQKWRQSQGGPPAMPPQDLPESSNLEKLPDTQHP